MSQAQQSQKNLFASRESSQMDSQPTFEPQRQSSQIESNNELILQKLLVEKDQEISKLKKTHVSELRTFTSRIDDLELQIESKDLQLDDLKLQISSQITPLQTDIENFENTEQEYDDFEGGYSDDNFSDEDNQVQNSRGRKKKFKNNLRQDDKQDLTSLKRALNRARVSENKLKQKVKDLEKEMATLRKENLKNNQAMSKKKKFCSKCGTTTPLTDKVKRAGTGYRSPMKYRAGSRPGSKNGSRTGSRTGSRLGSRKNSAVNSRKATPKNSVGGSRTSTPGKRKVKRSRELDQRRKVIGGGGSRRGRSPRGSVTSNYSHNSKISNNSRRSKKSNSSIRSKKAKQSATIGYRRRDLPTLEERRKSRERLGISSYAVGKRRSSVDSKNSRSRSRKSGQRKRSKSRGNSRNSSRNSVSLHPHPRYIN